MLEMWIQEVAAKLGSQAEASRILQTRLKRSVDRAAVNKMLKGTRQIYADEAIILAEISGVPLPAPVTSALEGLRPETVRDAAEVILKRMRHTEEEARKGAAWIVQTAQVLNSEPSLPESSENGPPQSRRLEHSNEE